MVSDKELALQGEVEENQAFNSYMDKARKTKSPELKDTFKDIAYEEIVHKGELYQRATENDGKIDEKFREGRTEAKDMSENKATKSITHMPKGHILPYGFDREITKSESDNNVFSDGIDNHDEIHIRGGVLNQNVYRTVSIGGGKRPIRQYLLKDVARDSKSGKFITHKKETGNPVRVNIGPTEQKR